MRFSIYSLIILLLVSGCTKDNLVSETGDSTIVVEPTKEEKIILREYSGFSDNYIALLSTNGEVNVSIDLTIIGGTIYGTDFHVFMDGEEVVGWETDYAEYLQGGILAEQGLCFDIYTRATKIYDPTSLYPYRYVIAMCAEFADRNWPPQSPGLVYTKFVGWSPTPSIIYWDEVENCSSTYTTTDDDCDFN